MNARLVTAELGKASQIAEKSFAVDVGHGSMLPRGKRRKRFRW
jgi:hypothetical protein